MAMPHLLWRHNRLDTPVAGAGIEPTYEGYEPSGLPLPHPASAYDSPRLLFSRVVYTFYRLV